MGLFAAPCSIEARKFDVQAQGRVQCSPRMAHAVRGLSRGSEHDGDLSRWGSAGTLRHNISSRNTVQGPRRRELCLGSLQSPAARKKILGTGRGGRPEKEAGDKKDLRKSWNRGTPPDHERAGGTRSEARTFFRAVSIHEPPLAQLRSLQTSHGAACQHLAPHTRPWRACLTE